MKTIFLLILNLIIIKVIAQNHLLGVTGGASGTNVTGNVLAQADYRLGVSGGITYEYFWNRRFSLGADVIYSQRGCLSEAELETAEKTLFKFYYDYVSLPVKVGFHLGSRIASFAKVVLVPSLLIKAITIAPAFDSSGNKIGDETFNLTKSVAKFDLAGRLEVGGGYQLQERFWITTSLIYQHSFTSITTSKYFAGQKINHYGLGLLIGLKWALKNE